MARVLTVIPAHNEEETIREVVTGALKYSDVSVTDDGSRDRTGEILREIRNECMNKKHGHSLNIIVHEKATHIPLGIQDGLKYGVQQGYDYVITMDAGMSHDPEALPGFIDYKSDVDVVIGMRKNMENVPAYRRLISKMAALVVNYSLTPSYFSFFGPGISDCTSGFRRYSRRSAEIIASSELKSRAFDFHMEALALCVRKGFSAEEHPIKYVFSNSSFNSRVLKQAMKFGLHLIFTKGH